MSAEPPVCRCHGVPMYPNGHSGGKNLWRCRIRTRERHRLSDARYDATANGQLVRLLYRQSRIRTEI